MQSDRSWGGCSIHEARPTSSATFLGVVAVLCLGAVTGVEAAGMQDGPDDALAIIVRSFERFSAEQPNGVAPYRALMTSEARKFDGDGQVTEEQRVEWEVIPIDSSTFTRRLAIDGQPLGEEALARENAREEAFRDELRRQREGEMEPEENENALVINEELFARFVFTLESEEQLRNRPSYRIAFTPREGNFPAGGRMDRLLDNLSGRVWIDVETFEAARVEYELIEPVRFGLGVLATMHLIRGSFDRGPALPGFWTFLQQENYSDIRVFLSRTRSASISQWSDFEWTEERPQQGASVDPAPSASDEALQ